MRRQHILDAIERAYAAQVKIRLNSALKHGITEETIRHVLGNIVLYEMDVDDLIVFHAMACRKEYQRKLFR